MSLIWCWIFKKVHLKSEFVFILTETNERNEMIFYFGAQIRPLQTDSSSMHTDCNQLFHLIHVRPSERMGFFCCRGQCYAYFIYQFIKRSMVVYKIAVNTSEPLHVGCGWMRLDAIEPLAATLRNKCMPGHCICLVWLASHQFQSVWLL